MNVNVEIVARERGKIVARRDVHNTWVAGGRVYLASMLGYSSQDPDVPEETSRLKYMGLGIGGVRQRLPVVADAAPLSTSYPAGSDPNTTNGHEYNDRYPISPLVSTLERPVRITGGSTAYPGAPADVWLAGPPSNMFFTHPSVTQLKANAQFRGTLGEVVYAPFDTAGVPISEAGLFTGASTVPGEPFNELVAYVTFDTLLLTTSVDVEFGWTVSF